MSLNSAQSTLITALMTPGIYDHAVMRCRLIETHISWVILTGEYAYKIKKPVNLGFLDFSTLEKRHFYCQEEVRLNKRLAAAIYVDVVAIRGTPEQPRLQGCGEVIEYAVKMCQFPQDVQLDRVLARGDLQFKQIDAIAQMLADFHQHIAVASKESPYGNPHQVFAPVAENFSQIHEHIRTKAYHKTLTHLQHWCESAFEELQPLLLQRKADGCIRECHGDLHLRNLAWYNGVPLAFDCLEFNADLRWIDVISEIAFLIMDLDDHQENQIAQRFLNAYLEITGDYIGIQILQFYLVYRAMVRAKVAAIRAGQENLNTQECADAEQDLQSYLQLADRYTHAGKVQLIITRGLSASGKTTETQPLLERLRAIRIRSDVERKRLFGVRAEVNAGSEIGTGIYSTEATQRTYARLLELAASILDAGYTVIVDAANLKREQRQLFQTLASQKKVAYLILEFVARPKTLRRRIMERQQDASDANLNVLEHQLKHWQPLSDDEQEFAIPINTEAPYDVKLLLEKINTSSYKETQK